MTRCGQRADAVIFTADYSEAGAINELGRDGAYLRRYFGQVRVAATLTNPYGIHSIEAGGHVYVCTMPRQLWGQLWLRLRHDD